MPEARRHLLIRADASARVGTGHVMRCLALAQGWLGHGGDVTLAMATTTAALQARIVREGLLLRLLTVAPGSAADAAATAALARECGAGWVIADGYVFGSDWQRDVRAAGVKLAVLDDYGHAESYFAHLILNQNVSAVPEWYGRREPDSQLALGPGFALLRREFVHWTGPARVTEARGRRVLVTLGGSDPDNVTARVLTSLEAVDDCEIRVVVGGSNPHRRELASQIKAVAGAELIVDATNMPELMAWADIAITAGGGTLWESAFMGLPALVLVLADNQVPATEALSRAGVIRQLASPDLAGWALGELAADPGARRRMSAAARSLVDGQGVERILGFLEAA